MKGGMDVKIKVPDYFNSFKCIADKCKDSCCIGWEIVIDDDSMAKYKALSCEIGREISEKTKHGCFPLDEDGRCAFLDGNGLCRIISSLGDGYLCDICREHPRYYGVGSDGIEGGIGLGCEEAARIVLSLEKTPELVEIERDVHYYDEDDFAIISDALRKTLYSGIFELDIHELIGKYTAYSKIADDVAFEASACGKEIPIPKATYTPAENAEIIKLIEFTAERLLECEALTNDWYTILDKARNVEINELFKRENVTRPLLYYFTHRYVRDGVEDMTLGARVLFSLCSAIVITAISTAIDTTDPEIRSAVLFSKNIEYSTDNVDYLLDSLCQLI